MEYTEPKMTVDFKKNQSPKASTPSHLEAVHVGRAIQIEKDVYLGAYTTEDGLTSAAITGIRSGATLLGDDEIEVSIQMDADAGIVKVPAANWSRTSTNISIDSGLVKVLSDHMAILDGSLVSSSRLLSSPTVDFSEIGMIQKYSVATLKDSAGFVYPDAVTLGTYDVSTGSSGDKSKLYFTGNNAPSEQRIVLTSTTNFSVGDTVAQAGTVAAAGTIIGVDATHSVIIVGSITGTFEVSSVVITSSGGGSTTITSLGTLLLPEKKLVLTSLSGFTVGCTVAQGAATGTIVKVDSSSSTIVLGGVSGTFVVSATAITSSNSGSTTITAVGGDIGKFGFHIALSMDGSARVSYKAFRTDLCGSKTKVTQSNLLTIAGNAESIVPENTLIWSAKIATDKSEYCYIEGVNDKNGQIHDYNATASAWNAEFAALKFQSQADCAYQYVILSGNSEVHAYMDLFVAWMRLVSRSKLVIGWSSFPMETMDYVVRSTSVPASHGSGTIFSDASKNFTTLGLVAGGSALFKNPANPSEDVTIRISSVSGSNVTLESAFPTMTTSWTYEMVNAIYSLDEIANAAKVYAEGFSSRAIRFAWCSSLSMKYDGVTYDNLPAFFWYSYRSADLSAALDLSKTYTNHDVVYLFTKVELPFEKGDTERLNTVASGGVDIIMQDKSGSPLYSRHALTSDMTDEESREQCATHQYDYAALSIFETYRKDIGKKKIDRKLMPYLLGKFSSIKVQLARKECLELLKLISFGVDSESRSRILLEVDGTATMPFNSLGVKFFMS